jgi:hypothetical protein
MEREREEHLKPRLNLQKENRPPPSPSPPEPPSSKDHPPGGGGGGRERERGGDMSPQPVPPVSQPPGVSGAVMEGEEGPRPTPHPKLANMKSTLRPVDMDASPSNQASSVSDDDDDDDGDDSRGSFGADMSEDSQQPVVYGPAPLRDESNSSNRMGFGSIKLGKYTCLECYIKLGKYTQMFECSVGAKMGFGSIKLGKCTCTVRGQQLISEFTRPKFR